MGRALFSTSTALLVLCSVLQHYATDSYPILIDVNDSANNGQTCLTLDMPDNDDVHMVFSNLPHEIDPKIESWVMQEMSSITDHESDKFLRMYSSPPGDIQPLIRSHEYEDVLDVTITGPRGRPRTQRLAPFKIVVLKNVAQDMRHGPGDYSRKHPDEDDDDWQPDGGIYRICIKGIRGSGSHAVFDHLMTSEHEEKVRTKHILKKEHLTPIETTFDAGIIAAHTILNEMAALERRETRMKHTSDSMNRRIRRFSYISIVVLLGVTWLQISYLKVYFKKKKVL